MFTPMCFPSVSIADVHFCISLSGIQELKSLLYHVHFTSASFVPSFLFPLLNTLSCDTPLGLLFEVLAGRKHLWDP